MSGTTTKKKAATMSGTKTDQGSGTEGAGTGAELTLVPLATAMARLGLKRTSIYKLAKEGKLRIGKIAGVNRTGVVAADVDALIAQAVSRP